jgi:hypothetical protein
MSDEFFSDLDKKLKNQANKNEMGKSQDERLLQKVKNITETVTPLLNDYKAKLSKRGITAKLSVYSTGFEFKMFYKDGGEHGFKLTRSVHSKKYQFIGIFTNDDGKNFTSEGGGPDITKFSIDVFEKYLQNEINDYLYYAERHRGIK